jgi:DNA-binding CsgD family transcriptional regulator/tetratricopeptide (TPR) repeat protein
LVQKIVAQAHTEPARQHRHQSLALSLSEMGAPTSRVAEQHWLSAPFFQPDAIGSMRAAAHEVKALSLEAALVWLRRALVCGGSSAELFDVRMDIASLLVLLGQVSEAETICMDGSTQPVDAAGRLKWLMIRTALASMAGRSRNDEALSIVEEVMQELSGEDPRQIESQGWKAILLVFKGDLDRAAKLATETINADLAFVNGRATSTSYQALSLAAILSGDADSALEFSAAAMSSFDGQNGPFGTIMLPHFARAMALLAVGSIDRAIDVLQEGCRWCDQAGHLMSRLHLEPLLSIAYYARGDLDIARASVAYTLERNQGWHSNGVALPTVTALAGYLAYLNDDLDAAREYALRTMDELLSGGAQVSSADFAVWCVSLVAEGDGDIQRARELLVGIWDLFAKEAGMFTIVADVVRLTRHCQPEVAIDAAERARVRAERSGAVLDRAQYLNALGFLNEDVDVLDTAASLFDSMGWLLSATKTRAYAIDMLREANPRADVDERVIRVLKDFDLMEAVRPARLIREQYVGKRKRTRPTEPTTGLNALSKTEQAVIRLISQGLTNKQIASRMFVSHRTVDTHVSHSLAKLGMSSRVQLAGLVNINA